MRVLHFGKYWRQDGGIETHVKTLCRGLAELGVEVVDLVSSLDKTASDFVIDGFRVVEAPTLGIHFSTSISPSMVAAAHRLHQEKPFDVVHLHFPDPMSHLASMVLPKSIPRVISWHSDIIKQQHLLKLYRPWQYRQIMQAAAIIVPTAAHFTSSLQIPAHYPLARRHVIPYGLDYSPNPNAAATAQKIAAIQQRASGRFIVFALGRHVGYKGFDVLLEAMQYTEAYLVLGGDGPLRQMLQTQAQQLGVADRVWFSGRLPSQDIAACYQACDIFCLPSVTPNEAFGLVQLEAMAQGKPVICTQLGNGVNAVNPHGITGLTVPVRDPHTLGSAIETLRLDAKIRQRLGQRAREHALTTYAMQTMTQLHASLYESLIAAPRKEQA
jgi:glycosyltransferase involved in cell wall biosynthesis